MENKHVAMVIKKEDKLLFIKRSLNKKFLPGCWSFPSGTMEEGELPLQTAIRETKEELNLNVNSARVLSEPIVLERVDLFIVLCEVEDGDIIADPEEIAEVEYMTLEDFFKRFTDDEIGHGLIAIRNDENLKIILS